MRSAPKRLDMNAGPSAAATAVQVSPTASEVAEGLRARKAAKDAKALPPRKHTKTDTSVAEKEPRGQTSAEALSKLGSPLDVIFSNLDVAAIMRGLPRPRLSR
jgi:hypothetical protein